MVSILLEILNLKKMKNNKAEIFESSIIDNLLESTSKEEAGKVELRMLMAVKIADAMQSKGWKNKDLMEAMGKRNPSVITKWLSGTHNFTMDTLHDLQLVLDIKLLNIDINEQNVNSFHIEVNQQSNLGDSVDYVNKILVSDKTNSSCVYYNNSKNYAEA